MVPESSGLESPFDPRKITRPDPALNRYYLLVSLSGLFFFPLIYIPAYIKYATLQYEFGADGVSMKWGLIFRHEVYLAYRRIQDIHVTKNIVQRWMGLATVAVQTASGSARPEMTIDGILEAEALRDFLYLNMRGAKGERTSPVGNTEHEQQPDDALTILVEIRDALRAMARKDA